MTLEELKAGAPRSFDKTLIDLMVAIQGGGQPIAVKDAPETHDKIRVLAQANLELASQLSDVLARLGDLEAHAIARVELK
jgi:hypothetical protein